MIKKIICGALVCACVAACASCGCANNRSKKTSTDNTPVETKPEAVKEIDDSIYTGEYAYYIPTYEWINQKSGDSINFENDGTFRGVINGKAYSGTFTLAADQDMIGRVNSNVKLEGADSQVRWTYDFKTSVEIYVTTADGNREYFAAKWWLDKGEKPDTTVNKSYKIDKKTPMGFYYEYLAQGWTNEKSGDTFTFNIDGSFNGKIASKSSKGTYLISRDKKNAQKLVVSVTRKGTGKVVLFTAEFDSSSKLTLTDDKGNTESYVADWTLK